MNFRHLKAQMGIMGRVLLLALRRLDDAHAEEEEVRDAALAGIADAQAGRSTVVATPQDARLLHERLMARLREGLARGS